MYAGEHMVNLSSLISDIIRLSAKLGFSFLIIFLYRGGFFVLVELVFVDRLVRHL